MYSAIGVEPTKLTAAISGWVRMASTASLSPLTTLSTPSGRPACFIKSAIIREVEGSFSDGFRMKVLPQASATGNIHIGTMAGKLNGVMPAQTPTGWRIDQLSTLVPTFSENSPFRSCGMPQANSTTSRPRMQLPLASLRILPCSLVTRAAMASRLASASCLNLKRMRARCSGGVADQPGRAALAAATALPTSAVLANGTCAAFSPVAGLNTSPKRPEVPSVSLPLIQ